MTWHPGIECKHGYDACPICDAPQKPKTPKRTYADPNEQNAYTAGMRDALMNRERGTDPLARHWPNAYNAGYWDEIGRIQELEA